MKLEDFQTPIADEIWDRHSEDGDDFSYEMYLSHRVVEKKLGLAVAALESVAVDSQERFIRGVAKEALAQIESK
jgi:hypothetical protein